MYTNALLLYWYAIKLLLLHVLSDREMHLSGDNILGKKV